MIPTQVAEWIVIGIGLAMGIISLVIAFLQKADFSPVGWLGLALAVLGFILQYITAKDVKAAKLGKQK